jgi:hypothetical protein
VLKSLLDPGDEVNILVPFFPEYQFYTGITFLALASGKYTFICVQRSSVFSSIGTIGCELPIQKSCKPVLVASGTGFFSHRALRCLSWDRFLGCLATTGSSILLGS